MSDKSGWTIDSISELAKASSDKTSDRVAESACQILLRAVYLHCGNDCSPKTRHVLPPVLRDAIRDYLKLNSWHFTDLEFMTHSQVKSNVMCDVLSIADQLKEVVK